MRPVCSWITQAVSRISGSTDTSPDAIIAACEALGRNAPAHVAQYGVGIEDRLTGAHETAHYDTFNYGVSNRGASVRIPGHVAREQRGYLEDRRPNANMDPYVVTRLMVETVCSAAAKTSKAAAKKVSTGSTAKRVPARSVSRATRG